MNRRYSVLGSVLAASLTLAAPVFAGPPLLCFPFETGGAKTLPMKGGDWKTVDLKRLSTGYGVEVPCADIGVAPGVGSELGSRPFEIFRQRRLLRRDPFGAAVLLVS